MLFRAFTDCSDVFTKPLLLLLLLLPNNKTDTQQIKRSTQTHKHPNRRAIPFCTHTLEHMRAHTTGLRCVPVRLNVLVFVCVCFSSTLISLFSKSYDDYNGDGDDADDDNSGCDCSTTNSTIPFTRFECDVTTSRKHMQLTRRRKKNKTKQKKTE